MKAIGRNIIIKKLKEGILKQKVVYFFQKIIEKI